MSTKIPEVTTEPEPAKEVGSKKINIKVANADGVEIFFQIKNSTKLKKLMNVYCKKQGLVPGSVRFTFDGTRINPETTAGEMEMDNDDVIDAHVEQTGGWVM